MSTHIPYRGIIVPIITPLSDWDTLDLPGLSRLVEHIIGGGVHGIFVLGTTGEGPSLSLRLQHEMIEQTCKLTDGRIPVLAGVTDTSAIETINMAEFAAQAGADAVVLSAPYYFPVDQSELLWYNERLIPKLPLPAFLYNIPNCTKVQFAPETVRQLLDQPNLIGLKDSSGDLEYFQDILSIAAEREDFSVLVGPELLLSQSVLLGGDGGVSGGANLVPELFVNLYHAAVAGDLEQVETLQRKALLLKQTIYSVGSYGSSFIKSVKCALSCLGICEDHMAAPFCRFGPEERKKVKHYVEHFGFRANLPESDPDREATLN